MIDCRAFKFEDDGGWDLHLFSLEICHDPWVIYHGTGGRNSDSIECDGLHYIHDNVVSSDLVKSICDMYKLLDWHGREEPHVRANGRSSHSIHSVKQDCC
jgi:hypothetical protein